MTSINISTTAKPPLQPAQWARNGMIPDASWASLLASHANQCAGIRLKELARFSSPLDGLLVAGGTRNRWRFAFRTSPYASFIFVSYVLASPNASGDNYAKLRIRDGAALTVGDADYHFGGSSITQPDTPAYFGFANVVVSSGGSAVALLPSTDYNGTFSDIGSRLVSATAYEYPLAFTTANGFLSQGYAALGSIYQGDRGNVAAMARSMWLNSGAPLWSWSGDTDPGIVNTTTTGKNVIDDTVTAVATSSPGVTLDLTNRSTVSRAALGVPVVLKCYAARTVSNGTITLRNSAGTILLTVSVTGTADWYSVAGYLPASIAKYDLFFTAGAAGTVTVYSASLYQG